MHSAGCTPISAHEPDHSGRPEIAKADAATHLSSTQRKVSAMDLQLTGKRVLVTGGTRGIGRAIVSAFLDEGAVVGFCARDSGEVEATNDELRSRGEVTGSVVDVGDGDALAAWVESSAEAFGGLDVVVANVSALAVPDTEENWQASLNVDIMHTVRLVRAAMPHLERSDAAAIIAISSVSGRESDFASGPYGTAKTAIVGYIHGLALQLADKNIRANTVSPGNTYFEGGFWQGVETGNPGLYEYAVSLNPTGHMGTPEEIAAPVVFLASPAASRVSGANLVVDGALTRGVQL
jgi:3-oxoacyl-[acyl-carrier protein] reductase